MSFSWQLALLIVVIAGCWQYGDTCVRQKYAGLQTDGYYEDLIESDTGYNYLKRMQRYKELKRRTSTQTVIDDVYQNLLCSYVYNCSHYMNLIRPLLNTEGKDALNVLIGNDVERVLDFEHQVVNMLNVLYNFGKIDSADPLWLMYTYSITIHSLTKNHNILNEEDKRIRLLLEHDTVYNRLTQHTERYCIIQDDDNKYNDQYRDSKFAESLEKISDFPIIPYEVIKEAVVYLYHKIYSRMTKLYKYMDIDNCRSYLTFDHLLLRPSLHDHDILSQLLKDFAEITDESEQERIHRLIIDTCSRSANVESFKTLTNNVAECHGIFKNVIKYVMFYNSWKFVRQVALHLPSSTSSDGRLIQKVKASVRKWSRGTAKSWIKPYSKKIYDYFKDIIRFLNLKEDNELKFISELFNPSSESMLADVADLERNKALENTVLAELMKLNSNYFILGDNNFSPDKFDQTYSTRRFTMLESKNSNWQTENIDLNISTEIVESPFSFFTFKRFLKHTFHTTDFQVIGSFNRFAEKMCLF